MRDFEDPDFNAYLDEAFRPLEVQVEDLESPVTYTASHVLAELDEDIYRNELLAWQGRRERELARVAGNILQSEAYRDRFDALATLLNRQRVIPFVGAGLSIPANYPGWRDFLVELSQELRLDQDSVSEQLELGEFESVATMIANEGGETRLSERIAAKFIRPDRHPRGAVRLLPVLVPDGFVITTNFDNLLPEVYARQNRRFSHVFQGRTESPIFEGVSAGEHHLFKLHGDARDPSCRILTSTEYDIAYGDGQFDFSLRIPDTLRRIFMHYPLLFLGCSLTRDRTLELFRRVAESTTTGDLPNHFAIVEEPANDDEWRSRERYLTDCNIRPIWYPPDEHDCVEALLNRLAKQVAQ